MTDTITVEGGAELSRTLHKAADDFGDMDAPGGRAANLVATSGRQEAPRLTGALASSIRPDVDGNTAAVVSALPYAGRTHYGWAAVGQRAQPFLTDPLARYENKIVEYYGDEAERILSHVEGA